MSLPDADPHSSTCSCRPAGRRSCRSQAGGPVRTGWPPTGRPCAAPWSSTARCWSAGSGCATRPRSAAVFDAFSGGRLLAEREAFAPREAYQPGVSLRRSGRRNQQMCMHHEQSYAVGVPGHDDVRLPHRAHLRRRHRGGRRDRGAAGAAAGPGRPVRARGLDAGPQLQRRDRLRRTPRPSAPTTAARSSTTAAATASSSSGSPTAGCAPGSAAAPWCATRSPGSSAGSTRSRSSTSGRSSRRSASSWSTLYGPDGLPFTTRFGARRPDRRGDRGTDQQRVRRAHPPRAMAGRATCCWSTTSAPRTAASPTRAPARWWSGMTDPVNIAACAPNAGGNVR